MNKTIRIVFEEVDGYPQDGTMKLWVDSEEIIDPLVKGTMIKLYAKRLPWQINPCMNKNETQEIKLYKRRKKGGKRKSVKVSGYVRKYQK